MSASASPPFDREIELPGPWRHHYVAANGARFHVAEADPTSRQADLPGQSDRHLVLLLHGFPQFWWAWRHQLPAVSALGMRAVAMDLRGYGASDKTPRGYDPLTLAADVVGVVRALGHGTATVVGHGWGGFVGWAAASASPECVSALAVLGAPHPHALTRSPASWLSARAMGHVLAMQLPWFPERRIARGRYVAQHLAAWSDPSSGFPSNEVAECYRAAFALWPSPHCALEYHRWLVRSRPRADGRAVAAVLRRGVPCPVLEVSGASDPAEAAGAAAASARQVRGTFERHVISRAGHFMHEERPDEVNEILCQWLSHRAGAGADDVV